MEFIENLKKYIKANPKKAGIILGITLIVIILVVVFTTTAPTSSSSAQHAMRMNDLNTNTAPVYPTFLMTDASGNISTFDFSTGTLPYSINVAGINVANGLNVSGSVNASGNVTTSNIDTPTADGWLSLNQKNYLTNKGTYLYGKSIAVEGPMAVHGGVYSGSTLAYPAVGTIQADTQICIGSTCISEYQLKTLLNTIVVDNRNDNQPPSWYAGRGLGDYNEFKDGSKLGGLSGNGYLNTFVGYGNAADYSGGPIIQTFRQGLSIFRRISTGPTTWGTWDFQISADDTRKIGMLSSGFHLWNNRSNANLTIQDNNTVQGQANCQPGCNGMHDLYFKLT